MTMRKFAVFLLTVFAAISATVLCAQVEENEELDPFDMINFDHGNMRMRKKISVNEKSELNQPPTNEDLETEDSMPTEEKESESNQDKARTPPTEDKTPGSTAPVEQEQKADSGGSCPALSLFQQFVSRLLRFIGDKVSQVDADSPTELCVQLHLTSVQVEMLESFKRDHSKDSVFSAHDVLIEAVQDVHVLNHDDPRLRYLWVEKHFGVSLDKILQVLCFFVCVAVLAVLLPRIRLTWLLFAGFVVSVGMTWYRLYKSEVAKQHEALMRDMPAGCNKMADNNHSIWTAMVSYVKSQVTFEQDACVAYYERLLIDPSVMVTPMEALSVALVQTMLKPLRTVGTEISEFIRALLKDLPVQWQFVSLLFVCLFVVLVLFLTCGYRFRIPFLLSIEPSHSDTVKVKALKEKISQLQSAIKDMDTANRLLLQQSHTVGALPVGAQSDVPAIGPAVRAGGDGAAATIRSQQRCQVPLQALASADELTLRKRFQTNGKEKLKSETGVKQTVAFEDGEDTAVSCYETLTKTVHMGKMAAKGRLVPTEAQSECQCSMVNGSDCAFAKPDIGADCPPPASFPDLGCSESDPETVGAVTEIGQSGDAARAKPTSLAKD